MTIEEKAIRYDEAIGKAAALYKASEPMSGCNVIIETLFPELAESEGKLNGGIVREDFTQGNGWYKVNLDYLSKAQVEEIEQLVEKWNPKEVSEDEKIKKAILIYLDWLDGKKDYLPKGDYTIKDMILWLEKQAEQEPNPCNGCINRKGCINCENGELRETEQKPIETVKWSPQEESCICQLESLVKEQWRQAERVHNSVNIKKMSELMFFLKTLNHNKKPTDEEMKRLLQTEYEKGRADAITEMQKDWSEEDEPQKELAESYLAKFDKKFPILPTLKGKQLADYKNFLNKCQQIFGLKYWGIRPIQAKLFEKLSLLWAAWGAEHLQGLGQTDGDMDNEISMWSEETDDDAWMNDIISKVENNLQLNKAEIDFLKSLRPQNHWKPSDKHIRFLQAMVNDPNNTSSESCQIVLKDILEKLKKLKEE